MKRLLLLLTAILLAFCYASAQDIIVKKDGTILNVYNLEESDNFYFYTLESSEDAAIQKINKNDVFSVKKGGEKSTSQQIETKAKDNGELKKAPKREPVTAQITSEIIQNKKGQFFTARTPDGHELNYQILSSEEHTLAVVKGKYRENKYIIPEYVQVGNEVYTVTEIGDRAFSRENAITEIQFPTTLKRIGHQAFTYCPLESIVLPEGLEELADEAFFCAGLNAHGKTLPLKEIYLPSSTQKIGYTCFLKCGSSISFRGFCQAYFSNMPDFIKESNCKTYGIDEEAVRAFYVYERKDESLMKYKP